MKFACEESTRKKKTAMAIEKTTSNMGALKDTATKTQSGCWTEAQILSR